MVRKWVISFHLLINGVYIGGFCPTDHNVRPGTSKLRCDLCLWRKKNMGGVLPVEHLLRREGTLSNLAMAQCLKHFWVCLKISRFRVGK